MSDFVKVASVTEIPDGQIKGVIIGTVPVAVLNLGGEFFALSDVCTHEECDLSTGFIEGQNLVCPCHGSQFDAKTGEVKNLPATEPLKKFEVKVENGDVLVKPQ